MEFKHHILVCTNEKPGHCGAQGGLALFEAFKAAAAAFPDVLVSKTGCTHQHACGTAVIAYPQGVWYKAVRPQDAPELIAAVRSGTVVERLRNPAISLKP